MLSPIPTAALLPAEGGARTRSLLKAMVTSAPDEDSRRIVVDQLEAFGLDAVSLVHNHGTQIVILPRGMKPEEAVAKYHLDEDDARSLKSSTAGLYSGSGNTMYLREDMLSEGFSARISAFIARHEFAHALEEALGSSFDVKGLYEAAREGRGTRLVSGYAGTNAAEYFAESTAAYLTPQDEFAQRLNPLERALFAPYRALSGYETPSRERLEQRDLRATQMLDDLFGERLREARTVPHRRKGGDYEGWLWRSHQVEPSDERTRIALLEARKARAGGLEKVEAECMIQVEYEAVERRLQGDVEARPHDRKAVFRLLQHYLDRADRLRGNDSAAVHAQRGDLEARAVVATDVLVSRDRAEADRRGGRDPYQRTGDYDYLVGQFQARGMEGAAQHLRAATEFKPS